MVAAPISMYFLTVDSIFSGESSFIHWLLWCVLNKIGNSTWAGTTAAVTANVVLFAYIVVAWQEDQGERAVEGKEREKKAQ